MDRGSQPCERESDWIDTPHPSSFLLNSCSFICSSYKLMGKLMEADSKALKRFFCKANYYYEVVDKADFSVFIKALYSFSKI